MATKIEPDVRDGVPWCRGGCPSAQSVSGIVQCRITCDTFPSVCLPTVRQTAEACAGLAGELERMRARILDGPPDVSWTVGGCTMLAEPAGPDGAPIAQLFAEWNDHESARGTIRTEPDRELVADVTIHAPHDREISDEARDVLCALFWSWWRAQIAKIQDEPEPLDREPKQEGERWRGNARADGRSRQGSEPASGGDKRSS